MGNEGRKYAASKRRRLALRAWQLREQLVDIGLLTSIDALHGVHRALLGRLDTASEQRKRLEAPEALEAYL